MGWARKRRRRNRRSRMHSELEAKYCPSPLTRGVPFFLSLSFCFYRVRVGLSADEQEISNSMNSRSIDDMLTPAHFHAICHPRGTASLTRRASADEIQAICHFIRERVVLSFFLRESESRQKRYRSDHPCIYSPLPAASACTNHARTNLSHARRGDSCRYVPSPDLRHYHHDVSYRER